MELNPLFKNNTFNFKNKTLLQSKILEKLRDDGIVILTNFCDLKTQNNIKTEFNSLLLDKPKWTKIQERPAGHVIHYSPLVKYLKKDKQNCKISSTIFKDKFLKLLLSKYLNRSKVLDRMIYTKDQVSDIPITEWHTDLFPTRSKCLKFFLYLSDTDNTNGAFSYIPSMQSYMHLLYKKHNLEERKERLHTYEKIRNSLSDLSKSIKSKGTQNDYKAIIKKLRIMDDHINDKNQNDNFFSIPAKAGTLIIFDAAGIHKGGTITEGERHVFRSHFLEFPLKRALQSKNELYLYLMNKVCRFKAFIKKDNVLF